MRSFTKSLPDTNAIVRYLTKDNLPLYIKAKGFFDKVRNGSEKAVILESVVAECIYVLTKMYQVPKDKAAAGLIDILHYKGIANSDREDIVQSLILFREKDIDIVDCFLCIKAISSGDKLFTFDEELNRVSRQLFK